jgi:hypothetical protein
MSSSGLMMGASNSPSPKLLVRVGSEQHLIAPAPAPQGQRFGGGGGGGGMPRIHSEGQLSSLAPLGGGGLGGGGGGGLDGASPTFGAGAQGGALGSFGGGGGVRLAGGGGGGGGMMRSHSMAAGLESIDELSASAGGGFHASRWACATRAPAGGGGGPAWKRSLVAAGCGCRGSCV